MPKSLYHRYKTSIIVVALVLVPIVILCCIFVGALACSEYWSSDRRPSGTCCRRRRQQLPGSSDGSRDRSNTLPLEWKSHERLLHDDVQRRYHVEGLSLVRTLFASFLSVGVIWTSALGTCC
ncbi:hypothetical protein BJX96DRAFT_98185 [Aspergillus floccosus]